MTSATHGDGALVAPAGSSLVADAELPTDARVAIVASRYHSEVIQQLLNGALEAVQEAGLTAANADVIPAAGAFELPNDARVAIVASRYHSEVIQQLLNGALEAIQEAGLAAGNADVIPAAGAFELGLLAREAAQSGRYVAVAALGCVIRGGTPHFEYVCSEASRAMTLAALDTGVPVGFGLITCDTAEQAWARAGGADGNKGAEAMAAALASARTLRALRSAS